MAQNERAIEWTRNVLKRADLTPEARGHHEERLRSLTQGQPQASSPSPAPSPKPPRAARKKAPATPPAGERRAASRERLSAQEDQPGGPNHRLADRAQAAMGGAQRSTGTRSTPASSAAPAKEIHPEVWLAQKHAQEDARSAEIRHHEQQIHRLNRANARHFGDADPETRLASPYTAAIRRHAERTEALSAGAEPHERFYDRRARGGAASSAAPDERRTVPKPSIIPDHDVASPAHRATAPSHAAVHAPTTQPQSPHNADQVRALLKFHEQSHHQLTARGDQRGASAHAQKAAALREVLQKQPDSGSGASEDPAVTAARLKAATGQANRAEASVKHQGAQKAYEKSRAMELHLSTVHGLDSPVVHEQKRKTAAIAHELSEHQIAMRRGSAMHAEGLHDLAAHRAEDGDGDEITQQRARGAAARAQTANRSVETAYARRARAQKRRTAVEQSSAPEVVAHHQAAERSRQHAADAQVRMQGLHEQVANHQHEIARLTRAHGPRSTPVQQERAALLTKQAQIKTLVSEHARHVADATHSEARAADLAGERRAQRLQDQARVRSASVPVREAQARTAQFKADHPEPYEQGGRDPLRERRERIKHASKEFHALLETGSSRLIEHMQRQVGH